MDLRTAIVPLPLSNMIRFLGTLSPGPEAFEFKFYLHTLDTRRTYETRVLIDSGASGTFISQFFVDEHSLTTYRLQESITIQNADGSLSQGGSIEFYCEVTLSAPPSFRERLILEVTSLGQYDIILGFLWLQRHNPLVDWKAGTMVLNRDTTPFPLQRTTNAPSEDSGISAVHSYDHHLDQLISELCLPDLPKAFDFLRDNTRINKVCSVRDYSRFTSIHEDMEKFMPKHYW